MAVPVCNRFSILADCEDSGTNHSDDFQLKRQAKTKIAATKTSTTNSDFSEALSSASRNGDIAKSRHNKHMASLERFNTMIAAKYPDLKSEVDLPEKFTCAVCWQIMVQPTHCIPCKHCFCEPCLRSIAFVANGRFRSLCPLCRQSIRYTTANEDLEREMRTGDHVTGAEYEKRLKWFKKRKHIAKRPLPGFAPLRWVSRVCPWSGPRASKFIDFSEQQLFDRLAFFALPLDDDHFNRSPPILTTIIDLLAVLFFFYFVFPRRNFVSFEVIEALSANMGMQSNGNPERQECLVNALGSGILYLLPFPELKEIFEALYWISYGTFLVRDFFRFLFRRLFASLHECDAGIGWYLPFGLLFLWSQMLMYELLAEQMRLITSQISHVDSMAAFACIWLGLTLLLFLNTIITKHAVKMVIWAIIMASIPSFIGVCFITLGFEMF